MNRIKLLSILLLIISWTFSAELYAKKSKTVGEMLKKIEKESNFKKKRSALPSFKKYSASKKKATKINLNKIKPPATSKLFFEAGTDEAELGKVTDQGIKQLFHLTRKYKNSSKRGELWLRLSELYVEKSRLIEYKLQNEYDERLIEYQSGKRKRKPRLDIKPAQIYNKKAIQLYEWFIRDFPKDKKMDQALFFLGYNYFELGDVKKGQKYYIRLAEEYPKSSYVLETNFSLGEFYFENEKWSEAQKYYSKVARFHKSRLHAFAVYKLAWTQFKQGQSKLGLKNLEKVIYLGRKSKTSNKQGSHIRLASEALKDLVIMFADSNSYNNAYEYFEKIAGTKSAPILYERLGNYYLDTGNRAAARYILTDLIEKNPVAPRAFDYQYKLVNLYATGGQGKDFRVELFKWVENYGPKSAWVKSNQYKTKLIEKSQMLVEATLRNYTLQLHQTAQNSRARNSQDFARKGYELYFVTFPDAKKIDEMHFFYAELLFDMKEFMKAAEHYKWIVDNKKTSVYFKTSLLNSILAYEKKLPTSDEIKKIVGDTTEPVEFDVSIESFIEIAKEYFEKVPQGSNRVDIKYKVGTLYYYYNQFDQAIKYFNEIIKEYPKTKFAGYAANLLLDIYNIKKDYVGLEQAAASILSVPGLSKTNVGAQVQMIKQKSSFKRAEMLEKNGEFKTAADAYAAFAKENPKSSLATSAYFNAGVNFEKANLLLDAVGMYSLVLKRTGKNEARLRKSSRKFLAQLYQRTGQYEKAAVELEKYAHDYPKDKISTDYIYNAAIIRDGMRHYSSALRGFQQYYDRSRKSDKVEVLYLMGKIWEKRDKSLRAIGFYEKYLKSNTTNKPRVIQASFEVASLYEKINRHKKSLEWYRKTVLIQKRLSTGSKNIGVRYAAEAKFKLVYQTYSELRSLKFPKVSSKQAAVLQKKLNLLNRLKEELKAVIVYDDAYQVVAALSLQGQALQHMANAIYNAPVPPNLSVEDLKTYRDGIDKIAKPLLNQAKESYKATIDRGFALDGYGDAMMLAMKKLNEMDSVQFPYHDEKVFLIQRTDDMESKR